MVTFKENEYVAYIPPSCVRQNIISKFRNLDPLKPWIPLSKNVRKGDFNVPPLSWGIIIGKVMKVKK